MCEQGRIDIDSYMYMQPSKTLLSEPELNLWRVLGTVLSDPELNLLCVLGTVLCDPEMNLWCVLGKVHTYSLTVLSTIMDRLLTWFS